MSWRQRLDLATNNARLLLTPRPTPRRYPGKSAEDIARATVEARWNGRLFTTSDQRHDRFTARDFGLAVRGLVFLDYQQHARETLRRVLDACQHHHHIPPALDHQGRPLAEACHAPDTLPFLLHALDQLGMHDEAKHRHAFLLEQAQKYERQFIDPDSRQLIRGRMFGGFKDRVHFSSTCTSLAMVGWCSTLLDKLHITPNPLTDLAVADELKEWFWTGDYFRNDLASQPPICSGDANLWPYWCGLIDDPALLQASLTAIRDRGLDHPLPLKFHPQPLPERELQPYRYLLPNAQGDTIAPCLGLPWIEVVARIDRPRARAYLDAYRQRIEEHSAFTEILDPRDASPLKGRLGFTADQGPIWAAELPRLSHLLTENTDEVKKA